MKPSFLTEFGNTRETETSQEAPLSTARHRGDPAISEWQKAYMESLKRKESLRKLIIDISSQQVRNRK